VRHRRRHAFDIGGQGSVVGDVIGGMLADDVAPTTRLLPVICLRVDDYVTRLRSTAANPATDPVSVPAAYVIAIAAD